MDTPGATHRDHKPAQGKHWLAGIALVVLLLAALAGYAYQQRTTLFITAGNAAVQPYGLSVEAVAGLRLSPTSLRIRQLDLLHTDSGARQTLHNIRADFTVTTLLATRIDTLSIDLVELSVPAGLFTKPNNGQTDTPVTTDSDQPSAAARTRPASILAVIPFDHLHIDQLHITGRDITTNTATIRDMSATLRSLQIDCRTFQCRMTVGINLTADKLIYRAGTNTFELDLVAFNTSTPISATLHAGTQTLSLAAHAATLSLPSIRNGDQLTGLSTSIQRLDIAYPWSSRGFDSGALYAHVELSLSEIYTNLTALNLWSMRIDQRLTWQDGRVNAVGAIIRDNQRLLTNDGHHDATTGSGLASLVVPPIAFNDQDRKLSDLLAPLPWQGDIVAGSASATARLNWQAGDSRQLTGTVAARLDEVSGYMDEIAFLRLSTDVAADLLPGGRLRSSRPATLSLASLDAGIEFSNIRSDYRFDSEPGSISLTGVSVDLFGGSVTSDQIDYQLQDNDSRFTIVIDSIDLSQVLGMSAYQGVSATGLVSGNLPVRLQGLRPSIGGGTLTALQPGGSIRYGSGATGDGSQSLDLVYQALEHYQFDIMETQVDYQESGELDLAIRMEGISPELNGGQRINLNLNINDNIPALLQSLQAARSVTDAIQVQLDARQNQSDTRP